MRRGHFITFEGGEGAGKSTQAKRLAQALERHGHGVVVTREPGGSPGAEHIRSLIVSGETDKWTPLTETLLVFAARADHLDRTIRPALVRGEWVICDRFVDSTFAYQGVGQGMSPDTIAGLSDLVVGSDMPGLTLILDLPVETGLGRAGKRDHNEDRFERMGDEFHQKLRQAFLDIAAAEPERCVVIDASRDEDAVAEAIWQAVSSRLAV
ncbi:dTMP kinase [Parvibaculum sp.]|uniref:dTMP kinase n=1 Tax=Parvibaculum sp. TaxID=2024848 RepID=UPI000C95B63C|nr:dTMP kinase [Parvibaculum sp.]MAB15359.1 dTMP kinase [Parvibaculum sp.]